MPKLLYCHHSLQEVPMLDEQEWAESGLGWSTPSNRSKTTVSGINARCRKHGETVVKRLCNVISN
ncbi:hypothetical protein [Chitinimonas lacunae]|uniref:Uncharacterized protein n=1 Tax=Chitinimonas lacunae TaxID=1963018 RepID=A0ABV8MQU0_9NEIS